MGEVSCVLLSTITSSCSCFDWAIFFVPSLAVAAASSVLSVLAVDDLAVVALDGLLHIFTTAVGHFDSASV